MRKIRKRGLKRRLKHYSPDASAQKKGLRALREALLSEAGAFHPRENAGEARRVYQRTRTPTAPWIDALTSVSPPVLNRWPTSPYRLVLRLSASVKPPASSIEV